MIPKKYKELAAIKDAFDDLPCGTAFFDGNGLPLLVNKKMYDLIYEIEGQEMQLISDLDNVLKKTFIMTADGAVWRFERTAPKKDDEFIEILAVDVTELYKYKQQLEKVNGEQREIMERMEQFNHNVVEITRNEEILAMKMNIHSDLGYAVGRSRQFLAAGCPEDEKGKYLDMQQKTVKKLLGEIGHSDESDVFEELLENAESLGMKINIDGSLPSGNISRNMLCAAVRECLMNAFRHADGNEVFVKLDVDSAVITNNGKPPSCEITEGGGLTSLRRKIEKSGGTLTIASQPAFMMTVTFPKSKKEDVL